MKDTRANLNGITRVCQGAFVTITREIESEQLSDGDVNYYSSAKSCKKCICEGKRRYIPELTGVYTDGCG